MNTSTTNVPPPDLHQDLSPRVVDLAREIDRLPPGTTVIVIHKQDIRALDWDVAILSVHHSISLTLPKHPKGASAQ